MDSLNSKITKKFNSVSATIFTGYSLVSKCKGGVKFNFCVDFILHFTLSDKTPLFQGFTKISPTQLLLYALYI